jgi:hypothetical protein
LNTHALLYEGAARVGICIWYDRPNGIVYRHDYLLAARYHQHLFANDDASQSLTKVLNHFPAVYAVRDGRAPLALVVDILSPTLNANHRAQVRVLYV